MYIMPQSRIPNVANMPFNAIRENKILAKISEYPVLKTLKHHWFLQYISYMRWIRFSTSQSSFNG